MKRFFFGLICLLLAASPVGSGSMMLTGVGPPPVAAGGPYVGPGDITSGATAWVGIRAYSAAKAGTKAINLCDNAGANCSDESTNASGNLVVGTHGANNCATSDTCLVKTLYDQSGSANCNGLIPCDLTQATAADIFTLKHNCRSGTQFCLVATSVTQLTAVASFTTALSQPYTGEAVGRRTSGPTAFTDLVGTGPGNVQIGFPNASGQVFMFGGTVATVTGATEGNMDALNALFNGASSNLNVNGSSNTVSAGTNSLVTVCAGACSNGGAMEFYEAGWWSGDKSSNFTAQYGNQHTYWGF